VNPTFNEFKTRVSEVWDLGKIEGVLAWDQATMMPKGGGASRAQQLSTIARIRHEAATSDEIGRLLVELEGLESSLPRESDEASLIRVTREDWTKARKIPADLAAETARAAAAGFQAWIVARQNNDFKSFLPYLQNVIELKKRYIECFPDVVEPYDALIDDFERGLTAADIRPVFARVRDALVPLVKLVTERADAVDQAPMHGHFPTAKQRELSTKLLAHWGFGDAEWRLDPTPHPFAASFATSDIRLTTRYYEEFLAPSLFGSLHECGHGLYEHGVSKALEGTALCRGASLTLHESQSRMFENLIGRSRAYWTFAHPIASEVFPEHFAKYDADAVYRGVNKMQPSLIRVEADELTYCLHIIVRFEIEQALFNGDLKAAELPEIWHAKMREYLGVEVPNDANGVLQDVHWSKGSMGYFATYALGTIAASQIWERMSREIPGLTQQIANGEFAPLQAWLVDQLHRHGRKFSPKETLAMVAGGPLDPEPYIAYLTGKVTSLYGEA
jgi:carboxypeptidase Taq